MSNRTNPQFGQNKKIKQARFRLEELENRTLPSSVGGVAVETGQYAENQIIVQWSNAQPVNTALSSSLQAIGNNTYDVYLQNGVSVSQAIAYYSTLGGVAYAEPDYTMAIEGSSVTPNNPDYSSQWSLSAINAPSAWGVTTGNSNIIVAVIDTGIDYNQPDLVNNLWHNTDGSVGWNFINNNNNPYDYNGHGTAVAGIIGADGNSGIGVAGVDWHVQMMALQFMNGSGSGSTSNAAAAIYWAVQHGAKIINASWGGTASDPTLASAISYAQQHGVIIVTAAGDYGSNDDTSAFYPANYSTTYNNLIAVAATDSSGNLASYSSYGAKSVALAAPGSDILTTTPNDTYTDYSGSSMAAAEVTGAMALVWGEHPTWTYTQVINAVLKSVDPMSSLSGKVSTGGELDLYKAVTYGTAVTPAAAATASITGLTLSSTSVSEYKSIGTTVGSLLASETGSGNTFTYSLVSGTGATNNNLFTIAGNKLETAAIFDYSTQSAYSVRVRATDEHGNTYYEVFTIDILNVSALVRNGKTLTVTGSSGNDTFSFAGGTTNTFVVNGVTYAAGSSAITEILFYGNTGTNTATIKDSGTYSILMYPTYDVLKGSNFTLILYNVSNCTAYGTSADTAYLYDGSGKNTFVGKPTESYMQGSNFINTVWGFQTVVGYKTAGSNDTAYLYDGSGKNTFVATATESYLQGTNFINFVCGFQTVIAYDKSGSNDTAYLYDGAGSNTFVGTSTVSYLQGSNFINYAYGFQTVWALATSGNNDTAYLYDGPGVNYFNGQGNYGYINNGGIVYGSEGFGKVSLLATESNQDYLTISSLQYVLTKTGTWILT